MNRRLPTPAEILEELADNVVGQIDSLANSGFETALDEMIRYHRFLLDTTATRTDDGAPISYAELTDWFGAPHHEWIRQYRRLFERAAAKIPQDSEFISTLAYAPLRLLPSKGAVTWSPRLIESILDLPLILIHRLEAWVTKRVIVETAADEAPVPRLNLSGSDKRAYTDTLIDVVGAWESTLKFIGSRYEWDEAKKRPDVEQWNTLSASWVFLARHLRNSAHFVAAAIWNEDEIAAEQFRDALVRWPKTIEFDLPQEYYSPYRNLLFPTLFQSKWPAVELTINEVEQSTTLRPDVGAFSLATTLLKDAHKDVLLVTAAVFLRWYMEAKQATDIAPRTVLALLRRELIDPEDDSDGASQRNIELRSLLSGVVRLWLADGQRRDGSYGTVLDEFASSIDRITERRVVPGRIFTPSTIHGRDELLAAFVAILTAAAPIEGDGGVLAFVKNLASEEARLPAKDQSLRNILELFRQVKTVATHTELLKRGAIALAPDKPFPASLERVLAIVDQASSTIKGFRDERISTRIPDPKKLEGIRTRIEAELFSKPTGVPVIQDYEIMRSHDERKSDIIKLTFNGISKGELTEPPMDTESGLDTFVARSVKEFAAKRAWQQFLHRPRRISTLRRGIEHLNFWRAAARRSRVLGPSPVLILGNSDEQRLVREWANFPERQPPPAFLRIEKKQGSALRERYIATIEGIDVYGSRLPDNKRLLIAANALQSVVYEIISDDNSLVTVEFESELEDIWRGKIFVRFAQLLIWKEHPIIEIRTPADEASH